MAPRHSMFKYNLFFVHTQPIARYKQLTTPVYLKKLFVAFPWVETSTGPGVLMMKTQVSVFLAGPTNRRNDINTLL